MVKANHLVAITCIINGPFNNENDLLDYAMNYAPVTKNIQMIFIISIHDWLIKLIWSSQTFAFIRLRILHMYIKLHFYAI